jgi:hypothetical protein
MNKPLSDKWIRKAIYDAVDSIVVDGETIYVYDSRVSGVEQPDNYVLMSSQTSEVDKRNKCEWFWESEILLDIRATFFLTQDSGSRLLVDNITDAVRNLTQNLVLDGASGLEIIKTTMSFPNDLNEITDGEIMYRKFIRLNLLIK